MRTSTCPRSIRRPIYAALPGALCLALVVVASCSVHAFCWHEAAARYALPVALLVAIAEQESGFNPKAINSANRNGTRDLGLMQINSMHLPRLARYGIREQDLFEPCTNVHVGAWVLANAFAQHGYTWNAVGAYNAGGDPAAAAQRAAYAWKIYQRLQAHARTVPPALPAATRSGATR